MKRIAAVGAKKPPSDDGAPMRRTGALLSGEAPQHGTMVALDAYDAMEDASREYQGNDAEAGEHAHPGDEVVDRASERGGLRGQRRNLCCYLIHAGLQSFTAW